MGTPEEIKEEIVMQALIKSLLPYGITNNLDRDKLLGQLITEQMDCTYCPVEAKCRNTTSVHYCGEFIREFFIRNSII